MSYIKYFDDMHHIDAISYIDKYPDFCPICSKSILPEFILHFYKDSETEEILCSCPNGECGSLFLTVYKQSFIVIEETGNLLFKLSDYYPKNKSYKDFDQRIIDMSPNFEKIYNQAYHADQEGLDLICGGAYRKSLEFLIKDYIIKYMSVDENKVRSMHSIQQCIENHIKHPVIKEMAKRAAWLGNDETHYIRKWEDKDITDLKNLIDLTVHYIVMEISAKKYIGEMKK